MSRVGKRPIEFGSNVKVQLTNGSISVTGPKGTLKQPIVPRTEVAIEGNSIEVRRMGESREARGAHGLMRTLIANMVHGVSEGFKRNLEIQGVGYRAAVKGKVLELQLGYSNPVPFPIPEGIKISVEQNTQVTIEGADKVVVGEVAASIKRVRPVEPYKGKGIRYAGENVRRKVGKAAVGAGG